MNRQSWELIKQKYQFTRMHWPTAFIVIFDLGIMFAAWHLSFKSPVFFIVSQFMLTLGLIHFYLLLHEATHSAVHPSTLVNDFAGQVSGWAVMMPFLPRQTSHLLHHTWTGHPSRDPANNRMIQRFSVITPEQVKKLEFVWKYWFPAIIINDRIGLWRAPFQQRATGLKSKRVRREIRWVYLYAFFYVAAAATLLVTGYLGHFAAWYLPSLFMCFLIEELANLPHHAETPLLSAEDKALPYWEQYKVTHSCKDVPVWSRFVLLNFNLHTAHHLYPTAPWYILNKLHDEIAETAPHLISEHQTQNELEWSLTNRKRPLLNIMGHYFDKIPGRHADSTPL